MYSIGSMLPEIAKYFKVTVDEVLGLVPIHSVPYITRDTNDREHWEDRKQIIENNRMFLWNDDYLEYLVRDVWKINRPINMIEFCCCNGDLGKRLLNILPEGSTYTGVDSQYLIDMAKENFAKEKFEVHFVPSDLYQFKAVQQYDMSICQASLRHMNRPLEILQVMKNSVKQKGLIVSIEINREIENLGLHIEGMEYDHLCTSFDWRKLWLKELENEGRDYAIGIHVPFYMKQIGLKNIDVRMNDKVTFVTPDHKDYAQLCKSIIDFRGWNLTENTSAHINEEIIDFYMSRGYKRHEVEKLFAFQKEMAQFINKNQDNLSFLHFFGFLITFGVK